MTRYTIYEYNVHYIFLHYMFELRYMYYYIFVFTLFIFWQFSGTSSLTDYELIFHLQRLLNVSVITAFIKCVCATGCNANKAIYCPDHNDLLIMPLDKDSTSYCWLLWAGMKNWDKEWRAESRAKKVWNNETMKVVFPTLHHCEINSNPCKKSHEMLMNMTMCADGATPSLL